MSSVKTVAVLTSTSKSSKQESIPAFDPSTVSSLNPSRGAVLTSTGNPPISRTISFFLEREGPAPGWVEQMILW
ncbi:hypothetical protein HanRHA438_Chr16g0775501 [Helianthus annuus]|nr:hypothetical protein HanRHA438_Chr16g0775501 [Helianthus annuus]